MSRKQTRNPTQPNPPQNRSTDQPTDNPTDRPINGTTNQSISQPINQSNTRLTSLIEPSINRPTDRPTDVRTRLLCFVFFRSPLSFHSASGGLGVYILDRNATPHRILRCCRTAFAFCARQCWGKPSRVARLATTAGRCVFRSNATNFSSFFFVFQ